MTETLFTRTDRLAGKCTHREYYAQIVRLAGLKFTDSHELVRDAKKSTDEHYNDIPLARWDMAAACAQSSITRALRQCGDCFTLSGGLCTVKEAVRQVVELA